MDSDLNIFGNVGITDWVQSSEFEDNASRLSLFPSWIFNEKIFSIIPIIYGVTHFVQSLMVERLTAACPRSVKLFIVPHSMVSVYDTSIEFQPEFADIASCLKMKGLQYFQSKMSQSASHSSIDICNELNKLCVEFQGGNTSNLILLFDRRDNDVPAQTMTAFECSDWDSFEELPRDHLIGFEFEMSYGKEKGDATAVRAYLNFGNMQRIRFYPEFMVSVFAKLFVTPRTMTEHEYLQKLYSAEYKKRWNLKLDDQRFNDIYKAITGTTLETNNYYRTNEVGGKSDEQKFGFLLFMERQLEKHNDALKQLLDYFKSNGYDSDTVIYDILEKNKKKEKESNIGSFMRQIGRSRKERMALKRAVLDWKRMDCGAENVFNISGCSHIQRLIQNLKRFKECKYIISAVNMKNYNLSQIISDFDHLVSAHNLFSGNDTFIIQRYIANQVDCERVSDCSVVKQFRNREQHNEKYFDLNRSDDMSSKCVVLKETLCNIHCYLLHQSNELYRLSSQSEEVLSRFTSLLEANSITFGEEDIDIDDEASSSTNESSEDDGGYRCPNKSSNVQKDEPITLHSGVSVTQWLPFGAQPHCKTLRDEMIENEDSTVTQEDYERMEIECAAKIKNTDYSLREMTALKFYSDLSEFTADLRKAHKASASLKVRKRYYHWARTLYRATIRHAVPILMQRGFRKGTGSLYHGLHNVFRVDGVSPLLFGPFSSTRSVVVADSFYKHNGLRLQMNSGSTCSTAMCLGIDMQTISRFGNEREIFLVDQPIFIKNAVGWDCDDTDLMLEMQHILEKASSLKCQDDYFDDLCAGKWQLKSEWTNEFVRLFPRICEHRVVSSDPELKVCFFSEYKLVHELDQLLGEYYATKNQGKWYFDERGTGRFRLYCDENDVDDARLRTIMEDDDGSGNSHSDDDFSDDDDSDSVSEYDLFDEFLCELWKAFGYEDYREEWDDWEVAEDFDNCWEQSETQREGGIHDDFPRFYRLRKWDYTSIMKRKMFGHLLRQIYVHRDRPSDSELKLSFFQECKFKLIHEIDQLLGEYYSSKNMGEWYFDKTGTGKFHVFCNFHCRKRDDPVVIDDDRFRAIMEHEAHGGNASHDENDIEDSDTFCERVLEKVHGSDEDDYCDFPYFEPLGKCEAYDPSGQQRKGQFSHLLHTLYALRAVPPDSELITSYRDKYNYKVVHELDQLFGEYYSAMHLADWYYNETGTGRFRLCCEWHDWDDSFLSKFTLPDEDLDNYTITCEDLWRRLHDEGKDVPFPCFHVSPLWSESTHDTQQCRQFEYIYLQLLSHRTVPSQSDLETSYLAKHKFGYKVDQLLGEYHVSRNKGEKYFDETGTGKFRKYIDQEWGYVPDDDYLRECMQDDPESFCTNRMISWYKMARNLKCWRTENVNGDDEELDEVFPFFEPLRKMDGPLHRMQQFVVIFQYIYEHERIPTVIELKSSILAKYNFISWWHIAESLKHEMYKAISVKMHEVMDSAEMKEYDTNDTKKEAFNEEKVMKIIALLQTKSKLSNKEVVFIRNAVQRARQFKAAKCSSSDS